jgi:hypothetical protein
VHLRGQFFTEKWSRTSILIITENKIELRPHGIDSQPIEIIFDAITSWEISDSNTPSSHDESGIFVKRNVSGTSDKRLYFGFKFVRDVKHTLEFYWNKHYIENSLPVISGSTHDRPLETVYTLSGEEPAGPSLESSLDIRGVDKRYRGEAWPEGQTTVGNCTQITASKHITIVGAPTHESVKLPAKNKVVKQHWRSVVKFLRDIAGPSVLLRHARVPHVHHRVFL